MKSAYSIAVGFALLIAVATGSYFNDNTYYNTEDEEYSSKESYEYEKSYGREGKFKVRFNFSYDSAFMGGLTTMGLGLVLAGYANRRKVK